jgi:large subunit ribosomal protein L22
MGARKPRRVIDLIRGCPVNQALDLLRNDRHRAAGDIRKVLAAAVANAMQNPEVKANRLVVSRVHVAEGPLLQGRLRFRPGPMGRAMPIRKRTCHIHVYVVDPQVHAPAKRAPAPEPETEVRAEKKAPAKKKAVRKSAPKKAAPKAKD